MGGALAFLAFVGVMVLFLQAVNMAKLTDVQAAQAAEAQSIADLATRIGNQAPPAATEADLDGVVKAANDNKAAVDALVPAV